jgi:hypothetical protein
MLRSFAQTGQFFDVLHQPGNVHGSNGAEQFMLKCFAEPKEHLKNTVLESRMDSAFFSKGIMSMSQIKLSPQKVLSCFTTAADRRNASLATRKMIPRWMSSLLNDWLVTRFIPCAR